MTIKLVLTLFITMSQEKTSLSKNYSNLINHHLLLEIMQLKPTVHNHFSTYLLSCTITIKSSSQVMLNFLLRISQTWLILTNILSIIKNLNNYLGYYSSMVLVTVKERTALLESCNQISTIIQRNNLSQQINHCSYRMKRIMGNLVSFIGKHLLREKFH